jgi:Fur family peroxide stress response transcriptional regulator
MGQSPPLSTDWFLEQCARAGIKATQQRREIYRELARTEEHPDAETVYTRVKRRVPAISLETVYRNLRTLEEHGVIRKVSATDYRTRFDANIAPHHHFVCTQCGMIRDFHEDRLDGFEPPDDVRALGEVKTWHLELRGVCRDCSGPARQPDSRTRRTGTRSARRPRRARGST